MSTVIFQQTSYYSLLLNVNQFYMCSFSITMMMIDVHTMSIMVSVSSILQSITLLFLFFLANKYRGIGIYTIGSILSSLGFLLFPMRLIISDPTLLLNMRFVGNLFITFSQIMYTIGIGTFVNKKIPYLFWAVVVFIFCLGQIYLIYIYELDFLKQISSILPIIIAHLIAIYYLLTTQERPLLVSYIFIGSTFALHLIFLILRIIVVPLSNTTALMQSNLINIISFWAIFLFDYLRNSGFIMMVIQRMYQDFHKLATTDFLTKVLDRRAIEQYIKYEIGRFEERKTPFSLILVDVDQFKLINHKYGHLTGNVVLKKIAKTLKKHLRYQDLISRWGGEEFMILLPNTNLETAAQIAEILRVKVESNPVSEPMIQYTISLGVGTFEAAYINSLTLFFSVIDEALYQAKTNGKNQVAVVPKID